MKDWVSLLVWLLASVWCFSFFCWVGPTVPGVWGEDCVPIHTGVDEDACAAVVDSDKWMSNFPKTHMMENMQTCQDAGRCNYAGVKIGEALRAVEDRDLLTMMLVFMMNTLVFCSCVLAISSGHRCHRSKVDAANDGAVNFNLEAFDRTPSLLSEQSSAAPALGVKGKLLGRISSIRSERADGLLGQSPPGSPTAAGASFEVEDGAVRGSLSGTSVCLSTWLPVCLSACLPVCLSVYLSSLSRARAQALALARSVACLCVSLTLCLSALQTQQTTSSI